MGIPVIAVGVPTVVDISTYRFDLSGESTGEDEENMIVTPNEDGTYKLELLNCPFKDNNGEEISGIITFPRVSKDGVDSFKNENVIPKSEIFSVIVSEE